MSRKVQKLEADVAIAGGGPGGCEIARILSKKGKKVVVIEKGGNDQKWFGTPLGNFARMEKTQTFPTPRLRRTKEGENLNLGTGIGGGTLIYAAAAFLPDLEYWRKHGVDIPAAMVDETVRDCWVNQPPDEFIGPGTHRVWDAARELGFPWEKIPKFIDFNKCRTNCDKCMIGCPRGAKWTGAVSASEAEQHGAKLLVHTKVRDVIVEGGVATGLRARGVDGTRYEITAKATVCAAGGIGTVPILKRAGLVQAGSWFAGDASVMTSGFVRNGKGNSGELSMSVGYHDDKNGCTFASAIEPGGTWHVVQLMASGLGGIRTWRRYPNAMSVMCKISDEGVGYVPLEGRPSRTMTSTDRYRLEYARVVNERILVKAGCDPYSIRHQQPMLGHPGMTVRVGKLLDSNLETQIKGLYCCDTSILPEAPGIPPALSIVVVGKYLAKILQNMV